MDSNLNAFDAELVLDEETIERAVASAKQDPKMVKLSDSLGVRWDDDCCEKDCAE